MLLGMDLDGTYTEDQEFWDRFIQLARQHGHEVVCVTMRGTRPDNAPPCQFIGTGGKAKRAYCEGLGLKVNVWVDDNPHYILNDVKGSL